MNPYKNNRFLQIKVLELAKNFPKQDLTMTVIQQQLIVLQLHQQESPTIHSFSAIRIELRT